jgi:hypothetical protein
METTLGRVGVAIVIGNYANGRRQVSENSLRVGCS